MEALAIIKIDFRRAADVRRDTDFNQVPARPPLDEIGMQIKVRISAFRKPFIVRITGREYVMCGGKEKRCDFLCMPFLFASRNRCEELYELWWQIR